MFKTLLYYKCILKITRKNYFLSFFLQECKKYDNIKETNKF